MNLLKKINILAYSFISVFVTVFLPLHSLTTFEDKIIDSNGEVIELKGVNWFGFNNQSTMLDGLWGNDKVIDDFQTVVHRLSLLGFNAVRLPFSFKDLSNLTPRDYSKTCANRSITSILQNVSPSLLNVDQSKFFFLPFPISTDEEKCNDYLPTTSTFDRFVWVVDFFAKNGFYVLIDNHLREDQTVLENSDLWVQQWVQLAQAISANPASRERVMFDLINEPDNYGLRWESTHQHPSLGDLYLKAMDALYAINPHALFFIEGAGQSGIYANWGDGFATDPLIISQYGLSDPNSFFQTLLSKPYLNQVVISPHIYPPSVTYVNQNYKGQELAYRLTTSFGYLTQKGYCANGQCKIFPVAVGEFGSRFTESKDIESLNDMAKYFLNQDFLNDAQHRPIQNWFYWSWNANSGDTGGIVTDDWKAIEWKKIDYLQKIGLKPWYMRESF